MISLINKIVHTGVKPEFPFPQKRKIILLNYLCLVTSFVLLVYLPVNYYLELPPFFYLINILGQATMWFCIGLNDKGKYGLVRIFTNIFLLIFINSFCLLVGEGTGVEYINIVLFMLPQIIFDSRKMIATFSIAAILCFAIVKFIIANYPAHYPHHGSDLLFYCTGMGVIFFSTYYILSRFKKEVLDYSSLIEDQHKEIAGKNKEIDASLRYARQIQKLIYYSEKDAQEILPNSFGWLRPHGIVSGDFMWIAKAGDKEFIAIVDCTGHGVPAALMTVVGHNLLNEGLRHKNINTPGELLSFVNQGLLTRFKQKTKAGEGLNDGMDIGICSFDRANNKVVYAGANRPLFLVRKKELVETPPTKCSLGGYTPSDQVFENKIIEVQPGDLLYLFSDGVTDQHGGEKGKKYSKKRLKEFLISIDEDLTPEQKGNCIQETFDSWMGKYPRTDDASIIGVKI
jgi:serine phosphatase RsbU (regulator of sigma subunit)